LEKVAVVAVMAWIIGVFMAISLTAGTGTAGSLTAYTIDFEGFASGEAFAEIETPVGVVGFVGGWPDSQGGPVHAVLSEVSGLTIVGDWVTVIFPMNVSGFSVDFVDDPLFPGSFPGALIFPLLSVGGVLRAPTGDYGCTFLEGESRCTLDWTAYSPAEFCTLTTGLDCSTASWGGFLRSTINGRPIDSITLIGQATVPEPETWVLMILTGAAGVLIYRSRLGPTRGLRARCRDPQS
jgi:hypothetical protein